MGDKQAKKGAAAKLAAVMNYLDILNNLSTFQNIHPTLLTSGVLDMLLDFARKAAKDTEGAMSLKIFKVRTMSPPSLAHLPCPPPRGGPLAPVATSPATLSRPSLPPLSHFPSFSLSLSRPSISFPPSSLPPPYLIPSPVLSRPRL